MLKKISAVAVVGCLVASPCGAGLLDMYNDIAQQQAQKTYQDAKACSDASLIQYALGTQETARVVVAAAVQKCAAAWDAAARAAANEGRYAPSSGMLIRLKEGDVLTNLKEAYTRDAVVSVFDARVEASRK